MRFEGKSALITGASAGIGRAAALQLAAEGAAVILGARRGEYLSDLAEEIIAKGGKAVWLAGDVGEEDYAVALVDLACKSFGGLDLAFNNAGILGDLLPATEMPKAEWDLVIRTNLTSAMLGAKHQIPAMLGRPGAAILMTSSFVGHSLGVPGMAAYAASKAGMIGLTQVLAAEYGPQGLRINAILPGGTDTAMARSFADTEEARTGVEELHALKRMATPEEIARTAVFLLSSDAQFVTGAAILADGGISVTR
ncbi:MULTISPECIES: SDR family oxidoreductase [unclassified Roseovarius]|uniref:SDR family oxidoreductase n=1 Tax=unclassified Roseovarius TaxID=2614913 RepID=UPI00273F7853|nr:MULTISPECIES: SDR family oxidoreductase [unclassified Roseovarius]